jgi:DNA-binding MarR family transcriptional regulator
METIALKHDMTLEEIKLLYYLSQAEGTNNLKEMSNITLVKKGRLRIAIQKLTSANMIRVMEKKPEENKEKKSSDIQLTLELLPAAENVLADLLEAKRQYQEALYAGLEEKEIEQYEELSEKINSNIRKML